MITHRQRRTTSPYRKATVRRAPARYPIDPLDPRNLRILDALFHEAALAACERPDEPDDEVAIRSIYSFVTELTRRP